LRLSNRPIFNLGGEAVFLGSRPGGELKVEPPTRLRKNSLEGKDGRGNSASCFQGFVGEKRGRRRERRKEQRGVNDGKIGAARGGSAELPSLIRRFSGEGRSRNQRRSRRPVKGEIQRRAS